MFKYKSKSKSSLPTIHHHYPPYIITTNPISLSTTHHHYSPHIIPTNPTSSLPTTHHHYSPHIIPTNPTSSLPTTHHHHTSPYIILNHNFLKQYLHVLSSLGLPVSRHNIDGLHRQQAITKRNMMASSTPRKKRKVEGNEVEGKEDDSYSAGAF
ncbi:hypothetical protein Pmani_029064 [Petrolisthes manimaculis]|uniref:Uncharacterized protein n=1 Tax=Petrolisthes manimaculis TaxID=1843537 RepID=A0AAE1NZG9_9EUCA|nr:hypothetical protein Pmani_029064 [Petrolisthes manimaculis]